jgi:FkbM family methyltransferase
MSRRDSGFRRWLRSLVGRDVHVRRQLRIPMATLGAGDGTWRVSPAHLHGASVVYSFGIGRDLGFERDLIERFGMPVHAFDPTPIALAWVATQQLPPNLHVHPVGISAEDGTARFAAPSRADWESFSMLRTEGAGEAVDAPVRRLATLMRERGHERIDLVKLDIEGAEYAVLPDLIDAGIRPTQILVEFHHRWREAGPRRTRAAIRLLQRHGYRIADVSPKGRELTFLLPTHPPGSRTGASA